jgi:ribosomal protein L12E/L44/L45/RPP1/RPP2
VIEKIHIPTREEQQDFFAKDDWEKDPEEELRKQTKVKAKSAAKIGAVIAAAADDEVVTIKPEDKPEEDKKEEEKPEGERGKFWHLFL